MNHPITRTDASASHRPVRPCSSLAWRSAIGSVLLAAGVAAQQPPPSPSLLGAGRGAQPVDALGALRTTDAPSRWIVVLANTSVVVPFDERHRGLNREQSLALR